MSKTYRIKSNQRLFDQWMKVSAQCTARISGMHIVQNDITTDSSELNEWFRRLDQEIEQAEQDFQDIIRELKRLRADTIDCIKRDNS